MPLPTAPAKRAALLSEKEYDVPAKAQPRALQAESPTPEVTAAPRARSRRAPVAHEATSHPSAFLESTPHLPANQGDTSTSACTQG